MNPQELQQKIAEYYEKLSPETQKAFSDMGWMETLKAISSEYSFTPEQIEILGTETTLVLLGIVHPDQYETELISQLKMDKEKVDKIIVEINEKILKKIRPQLDEVFTSNLQELADKEDEAPLPPYKKESTTPEITTEKNPPANLPIMVTKPITPVVESPKKDLGVMESAGIELINSSTPQSFGQPHPSVASDSSPSQGSKNTDANSQGEEKILTMKEDKLMIASGINLIPEKPISETSHLSQNIATEKSTLYGIEHPQNIEGDIIRNKLKGAVLNTATVSDHGLSVNKNPIPQSPALNNDKYHESV